MRKKLGKFSDPSLERNYRRRLRIRSKVSGTSEIPRICATKSNKHLRVQVIDDTKGLTLLTVQTFGKNAVQNASSNVEGAKLVGQKLASEMAKQNITTGVFDRSGNKYTGVTAALVDALRTGGIRI